MAGRSDFYTATLPRNIKRMLSLMSTGDSAYDTSIRKMFIEAHAIQVACKRKRRSGDSSDADTTDDVVKEPVT